MRRLFRELKHGKLLRLCRRTWKRRLSRVLWPSNTTRSKATADCCYRFIERCDGRRKWRHKTAYADAAEKINDGTSALQRIWRQCLKRVHNMYGEFQDQRNYSISSMFSFIPSDMHRWLVESFLYMSILSWTNQFRTSSVLWHAQMIYTYRVIWRLICHYEGSWVQYVTNTWTFGSNWLATMFSNITI